MWWDPGGFLGSQTEGKIPKKGGHEQAM